MNKVDAQKRIIKLRAEIERYRYAYHVLDKSEISDAANDSLKHELEILERQFPELITPDSPTQRVGGQPLREFKKVRHIVRQWSFYDAFSESEMLDWEGRLKKILQKSGADQALDYVCELKIDGLHVVLTYVKGLFVRAATRGDGMIGEDVTQNVKTIESLPLRLKAPIDLICEGEIFMSKKVFSVLNQKLKKAGKSLLANPRNAAAGGIRQLDPKIAAARKLDLFIYKIDQISNQMPEDQLSELKMLLSFGFKVNPNYRHCQNLQEVFKYYQEWHQKKETADFWFDGIVIKVNSHSRQQALGYVGKGPRFVIAYKFSAEEATTVVLDIKVQVGRTGALTPVAILQPTQVAGSLVSRATLHNEDEIKRLGLKIGDTVIIHKAGDIIPEVIKVLPALRIGSERDFKMPKYCAICGSSVVKSPGEVAYRCSNQSCYAQEREKMIHFVGKSGFDIKGLGEKIILKLMDEGLITAPQDIFALKKGDLTPLERFAEKSADNLIDSIQEAKQIEFKKFITAIGIRYVGKETASLVVNYLAKRMDQINLKSLIKTASGIKLEKWRSLEGIGEKVAASLEEYFQNSKNIKIIKDLENFGVNLIYQKSQKPQKLSNLTFVLTGTLESLSRDQVKTLIEESGGNVSSAVSAKTDYVVAGSNPGSKYAQAKKLGIKIINEKEFLERINN